MNADLLAELAHLFYTDAQDWEGNLGHGQRERDYLYKCSRALAERAVKGSRCVAQGEKTDGSQIGG